MPATRATDWRTEFGLEGRNPPNLYTSTAELNSTTKQAHLLRRAFDVLEVDGILCVDHSPLAYFKLVKKITPENVAELHRKFWNHGGAALLVLVTDDCVQIYSGMARPEPARNSESKPGSFVDELSRVADGLKELVVAVESGEFFHTHTRSFDPNQRVDRHLLDNLQLTRDKLVDASRTSIPEPVLNALLCRLVFTCYLFDREVIGKRYLADSGIRGTADLRELLGNPSPAAAIDNLYCLFEKLKEDFNGDLFSDDLAAERKLVQDEHIRPLHEFFRGMTVGKGQGVLFRLYDFKFIPIETISAIYERFLNADEQQAKKAFYTPRFLAEVVLDTALDGITSLLGKRFLDPACGSGIFLVGLFNRIAEEWKQANPKARNDRKAKELMRLLRESLFGVDISLTACRITAFSLYLAYLDQLTPPDIQALQAKGRALPKLVVSQAETLTDPSIGNIREADFFAADNWFPKDVTIVVGNPPWGPLATDDTAAGLWCASHKRPLPAKQIAAAFIWKAAEHVAFDGRVCFVLPAGVLFNHSPTALGFQKAWVRGHAIDRVLNLADFQRFLFEKAGHPALVVSYRQPPPDNNAHHIEYWGPKADWTVTKAEVISIAPQDRTTLMVGQVLRDLEGPDAPQVWKQRFWATPRDWRLLDRLGLYPRLRDLVSQTGDMSDKPWRIATGLRLFGANDPKSTHTAYRLPTKNFISTTSASLDLVLLESDCELLSSDIIDVRRNHQSPEIFLAPHVVFTKGFSRAAFADCDVAFLEAVRGIHGPQQDRDTLAFLAAYLRTSLAQYFVFHTSSNWGISRQEAHVEEVLRLPFPLPDSKRGRQIVREVAKIVDEAALRADEHMAERAGIVRAASAKIEPLVEEYFDIIPHEKDLIEDTVRIVIASARPTRAKKKIETIFPSSPKQQQSYRDRVCEMLNGWAKSGPFAVHGQVVCGDPKLGIAIAIFEKVERARVNEKMPDVEPSLVESLNAVRKAIPSKFANLDVVRGVMVFHGNRLYVVKPIGQRFWTKTAAMNDADEIAGTILMRSPKGDA